MKILRKKIIVVAAAAALLAALCAVLFLRYRKRTCSTVRFHMDTYISYYIKSSMPEKVVEAMDEEVARCEKLFDRFSTRSEIYEINENAGSFTEVTEETYLLVSEALKLAAECGGYFDPTLGALSDLWGFGSDPHVPDSTDISAALEYTGYDKVLLSERDGRYFVCAGEGQSLDLGGIAKGYALRRIGEVTRRFRCSFAVVSFGGNVLLVGEGADGKNSFSVGIRTPEENSTVSAVRLDLGECVVSTSGSYERFFIENGVRYCHIIDPFTGSCAAGDLVSVSVVCSDPVEADCLSTALFVRGLNSTLDALASGELTGIAIDSGGTVYVSADLFEAVDPDGTAEGYRIEVIG